MCPNTIYRRSIWRRIRRTGTATKPKRLFREESFSHWYRDDFHRCINECNRNKQPHRKTRSLKYNLLFRSIVKKSISKNQRQSSPLSRRVSMKLSPRHQLTWIWNWSTMSVINSGQRIRINNKSSKKSKIDWENTTRDRSIVLFCSLVHHPRLQLRERPIQRPTSILCFRVHSWQKDCRNHRIDQSPVHRPERQVVNNYGMTSRTLPDAAAMKWSVRTGIVRVRVRWEYQCPTEWFDSIICSINERRRTSQPANSAKPLTRTIPWLAVGCKGEMYNLFTSSTRLTFGRGIFGGVLISTT